MRIPFNIRPRIWTQVSSNERLLLPPSLQCSAFIEMFILEKKTNTIPYKPSVLVASCLCRFFYLTCNLFKWTQITTHCTNIERREIDYFQITRSDILLIVNDQWNKFFQMALV